MPQYIAVRCCSDTCARFQVQQVKKQPRYTCPICQTAQTVQKVYCKAAQAASVRKVVAALNAQHPPAAQLAECSASEQEDSHFEHEGGPSVHHSHAHSVNKLQQHAIDRDAWKGFVKEEPACVVTEEADARYTTALPTTNKRRTKADASEGGPQKRQRAHLGNAASLPLAGRQLRTADSLAAHAAPAQPASCKTGQALAAQPPVPQQAFAAQALPSAQLATVQRCSRWDAEDQRGDLRGMHAEVAVPGLATAQSAGGDAWGAFVDQDDAGIDPATADHGGAAFVTCL